MLQVKIKQEKYAHSHHPATKANSVPLMTRQPAGYKMTLQARQVTRTVNAPTPSKKRAQTPYAQHLANTNLLANRGKALVCSSGRAQAQQALTAQCRQPGRPYLISKTVVAVTPCIWRRFMQPPLLQCLSCLSAGQQTCSTLPQPTFRVHPLKVTSWKCEADPRESTNACWLSAGVPSAFFIHVHEPLTG